MFAQQTIRVEEVARELEPVRLAIGSGVDVAGFAKEAFRAHRAVVSGNGVAAFDLTESPRALREAVGGREEFKARFELPVQEEEVYLSRTHPVVEGLATYVMDTALDPQGEGMARRCGVIRTSQVSTRTTVLLMRYRYHIITRKGGSEHPLLAEDCQVLAFEGSPQHAEWLDLAAAEGLLRLTPEGNVSPDQASHFIRQVIEGFDAIQPHLKAVAEQRGEDLLDAHRRVRTAVQMRGVTYRVEPLLPPDVLGIYVYLPTA